MDRLVALDGVRSDIVMMRTPDGHGRVELDKFRTPPAVRAEPEDASGECPGYPSHHVRRQRLDAVLARLRSHGAELVGEVVQYEDSNRLCYVRGPKGIMVALAEQLK